MDARVSLPIQAATWEMLERLVGFDTTSRESNLELIGFIADYLADYGIASSLSHDDSGSKANLFATIGEVADGGIVLSGLGLKFSAVLIEFAGGSLFFTVVLVTLISIIIGMGSSTTGSYIILAVVAAPALIQLGVPEIPAHLVVFYAACLSNITPPVCVSAYAAAAIAGSDPMRTGFAALKFGITLALIPFSFVYAPELLLYGSAFDIVTTLFGYLFGYLALAMLVQGAEPVHGSIALWQRGVFALSAFCLLFPTSIWIDLIGLGLLVAGWMPSIIAKKPAAVTPA